MWIFLRYTAFILLIMGTLGLLSNEFIFHWGRPVVLTMATLNVAGLAILAFTTWGIKKKT